MSLYKIDLYIDGVLVGDVRRLAQNFKWVRRRTKSGADEIDFTINDVLFEKWLSERQYTVSDVLRPMALECRVSRNGTDIVGGFLATIPAYSPNGTSANLALKFDGYLNLLDGVYIYPIGTAVGKMGALVQRFIGEADTRATNAGKGYGFTAVSVSNMASVQHTFDNYKSTKEWICDRCDNTEGAGPFDVYFYADKSYAVIKDSEFGTVITDWVAVYPTRLNGVSATSITAPEVMGFASRVIGIGAGEVSASPSENTAIVSTATNSTAVQKYGYFETIVQDSSISVQSTLNQKVATTLDEQSNLAWEPQITLSGVNVAPVPSGVGKIWLGDTITIKNYEDTTGTMSGAFRVNELAVDVSASDGEKITPVLERA